MLGIILYISPAECKSITTAIEIIELLSCRELVVMVLRSAGDLYLEGVFTLHL